MTGLAIVIMTCLTEQATASSMSSEDASFVVQHSASSLEYCSQVISQRLANGAAKAIVSERYGILAWDWLKGQGIIEAADILRGQFGTSKLEELSQLTYSEAAVAGIPALGLDLLKAKVAVYRAQGMHDYPASSSRRSLVSEDLHETLEHGALGLGWMTDLLAQHGVQSVEQLITWVSSHGTFESVMSVVPCLTRFEAARLVELVAKMRENEQYASEAGGMLWEHVEMSGVAEKRRDCQDLQQNRLRS